MTLPAEFLQYPWRRHGMDHDRYPFSNLFERKPAAWPEGAKVALWVVPALEFFPLNPSGKPFKAPGSMVTPYPDFRHYTTRDYGNRVGIYRIFKVLDELKIPASVAFNSVVAERYPALLEEVTRRGWEVIAHGVDMDALHYGGLDEAQEAGQIETALATLRAASGQPVTGWLSPAKSESFVTPDLLAARGVEYVCDWVNDDMPYAMQTSSATLYSMPHSTELSDRQILIDYHFSEDEYVEQVQDAFDCLYAEAADHGGRVLCLPVIPYISGLPYRIRALRRALEYVLGHEGVWPATGRDILTEWQRSQG
ncbi:MAG: polysaccharide deacetylase family protein [Gammaproteobacteria bacterium]|nr:polysaccharide deacetylase family protein [Gammaproteobacteria bacterium]